ncbi:hypothetical protein [Arthrobacter glacialis]|uniref:Uncharacterized protein n=1 Tax=Arthrobacter glacialis TaxID=1664 RepID=A0A2S3ZUC7_ARTGL|nr:hypothetical protein [Arthrobacter glacialis]POH72447.1 hypothetical protein CVS27_15030 [Arthrobacter glacialis]
MPLKVSYSHNRIPEEQAFVCQELFTELSVVMATADTFREGTAERIAAVSLVDRRERALTNASNQFFSLTYAGRDEYQRAMLILGMARTATSKTRGIFVGALGGRHRWSATDSQVLEALQAWRSVDLRSLDTETLHTVTECGWDDWITFLERAFYRDGFSTVIRR